MKMHNDPHSWQGWLELFQSWWRGDTPLGAVLMSLFMAGLRIAYFGGNGGWKKKHTRNSTLRRPDVDLLICAGIFRLAQVPVCCDRWRRRPYRRGCDPRLCNEVYQWSYRWG